MTAQMKRPAKAWFDERLGEISSVEGYKKPIPIPHSVKLDSNENYVVPKGYLDRIISQAVSASNMREYPLGGTERLIKSISKHVGLPPSMIGVGNGSDQILDLILSNFASPNTVLLTSDPTFGFFEKRCKLYSIPVITAKFSDEMKLDIDEMMTKSKEADILYIDSPNNPTGFQFPKQQLRRLVHSFEGLVIVDEAYGMFGDYSLAGMVRTHNNLIVTQTFSKSFGLAGLRLGYFMACKKFVDAFTNVIQYPYPLNTVAIESATRALADITPVMDTVATVKEERQRITKVLRRYDAFDVFESRGNFVLFDAHGAYRRVFVALTEQGISVRKLGRVGNHEGCLRVTVGTKKMNSRFLLAIRDYLG